MAKSLLNALRRVAPDLTPIERLQIVNFAPRGEVQLHAVRRIAY